MRTPFLTLLALAGALAVPATAAAHHGRGADSGTPTFERTFRFESRLCAAADAGTLPAPLQGSEAQVKAACAALHSAFDAAVAAAGTAAPGTDAFKSAIADARAKVEAACGADATD